MAASFILAAFCLCDGLKDPWSRTSFRVWGRDALTTASRIPAIQARHAARQFSDFCGVWETELPIHSRYPALPSSIVTS